MENDNDLVQEKLAMDIITGSMYSTNLLKNFTVAIFDPNLKSLTIGELYEQWKKMCGFPEDYNNYIPYSFGSIVGYLYCGILLSKEKWFDLLPEDKIDEANIEWGFSSATYSCPKKPSPTIRYAIRRMRNALGHGNILINVPKGIKRDKKDKDDFEKKITLKFHDVDPRNPGDTFDIEIPLLGLSAAIKKFHSITYKHVTSK